MAKKECPGWLSWIVFVAGLLYLLAAWIPTAFSWWVSYFPWYAMAFTVMGLWGITKK